MPGSDLGSDGTMVKRKTCSLSLQSLKSNWRVMQQCESLRKGDIHVKGWFAAQRGANQAAIFSPDCTSSPGSPSSPVLWEASQLGLIHGL